MFVVKSQLPHRPPNQLPGRDWSLSFSFVPPIFILFYFFKSKSVFFFIQGGLRSVFGSWGWCEWLVVFAYGLGQFIINSREGNRWTDPLFKRGWLWPIWGFETPFLFLSSPLLAWLFFSPLFGPLKFLLEGQLIWRWGVPSPLTSCLSGDKLNSLCTCDRLKCTFTLRWSVVLEKPFMSLLPTYWTLAFDQLRLLPQGEMTQPSQCQHPFFLIESLTNDFGQDDGLFWGISTF